MLHYSQLPPEFIQRDCVIGGDECVGTFVRK